MRVLNFGSLNLDLVYQVPHFVRAGETISTTGFQRNVGGKGLNQSVALAKAGAQVFHAGLIGADGAALSEFLEANGVDTRFVRTLDQPSGHAVIQVDATGNNCIFLYGGANRCVTGAYIEEVLQHFDKGDYLVLQNEINAIDEILAAGYARGMEVVLNPSPIDDSLKNISLDKISWLILNEIEGKEFTGESQPERIIARLLERNPKLHIVLTLGSDGAVYADCREQLRQPACRVNAVDTTAAGDTFTGYFFAGIADGQSARQALSRATIASAISVTRQGAAASIPHREEVLRRLRNDMPE